MPVWGASTIYGGADFPYGENMERQDKSGASAVEKGIELFVAALSAPGGAKLAQIAHAAAIPLSTAHRLMDAYLRAKLLVRVGRGHYAAGPHLLWRSEREAMIEASRPHLRRFARDHGVVAHLGVFEGDMVSYLIKESGAINDLWTSETNQLEGYGSAIGKVLLAYLDHSTQQRYLQAGPFVPFTSSTITDPAALTETLHKVYDQGYAVDDAEVEEQLFCLAVPVPQPFGQIYAISISSRSKALMDLALLPALRTCASDISSSLNQKNFDIIP